MRSGARAACCLADARARGGGNLLSGVEVGLLQLPACLLLASRCLLRAQRLGRHWKSSAAHRVAAKGGVCSGARLAQAGIAGGAAAMRARISAVVL